MRWDVILALLVGSVGGVVIGAIPGVGPAVALQSYCPRHFPWINCGFNDIAGYLRIVNVRRRDPDPHQYTRNRSQCINTYDGFP